MLLALELERVDGALGDFHASEFPPGDGHLFDIELLGQGLRLPFGFQITAELLKILLGFAGQDDAAGAQAVTQGVQADGGLSLGSSGASREERVATVGLDLLGCCHSF